MHKEGSGRILLVGIMVLTSLFSLPKNVYAADPDLDGPASATTYSNQSTTVSGLQVVGTGNPTVPVKLRVVSGTLSMTTTTGLTFTGGSSGSTLQFSGTLSNINTALATLRYNRSGTGSDTIEASLVNAGEVFFEGTNHLYEYVSYNSNWNNAKTNAEGRTKYGATGYLTTITSEEENNFVAARLSAAGWMGASDSAVEGTWRWVTGPENGDLLSSHYTNWNSGEPNDSSGEDCAQFLSGSGQNGKWNDLPCSSYNLPGYVVEYGSGSSPIDIATHNISITTLASDVTPPTITNISSDKTNGSYKAGEVIDIDVTFSETVTSTGNVTVTLETGTTDRTCTFTVTSSTTGTCNYTVQAGDTTNDLTVQSISGTIKDASNNSMTNFVPATNLAANKALVIDTTAPTLFLLSPTDGEEDVSINTNISLYLNERISLPLSGVGSVIIRRLDNNQVIETIDSSTGQIDGGSMNILTVNPTVTLESETAYYIEVTNTAVKDVAGNNYAGISDTTTWNFTTEDIIAPTLTGVTPADGSQNVELATNLVLNFSEPVNAGTGNIIIKKTTDDTTVETIDVTSGLVTGNGTNALTINPSTTLAYETDYYVVIDAGAFVDDSPNANDFAGISDKTVWNFVTRDKPNEVTELDIKNIEYSAGVDFITITWETDHDADSQVRYGLDRNLSEKKKDSKNEEKHSMTIKNLAPNTLYYFRVSSEDKYGNDDSSKIYSIATKAQKVEQTAVTGSLEPTPNVPTYQNLVVETKDPKPSEKLTSSSASGGNEEGNPETESKSENQPKKDIVKEFVTSVIQKDDQQYIQEVKFRILDEFGNPIPNLPVTLHSEPRTGTTNEDGVVTFTEVPTGEHHILFAYADKEIEKAVTINDVKDPKGEVKAQVIEVMAVRDPAPLWTWIVMGLLSIALIITLWLLLAKKKKEDKEENKES